MTHPLHCGCGPQLERILSAAGPLVLSLVLSTPSLPVPHPGLRPGWHINMDVLRPQTNSLAHSHGHFVHADPLAGTSACSSKGPHCAPKPPADELAKAEFG